MARIIVTGYMIRHPVIGSMLSYFQYLLGFFRLGHQVSYLEESGWPDSCYNPQLGTYGNDPGYGITAVQALMARHNIDIPIYYVDRDNAATTSIDASRLKQALSCADLLVNIGGVCSLPEFHLTPRRVLIDMDPLFTQVGRFASEDIGDYQVHFSYGTNIGQPACTVPTCGLDWLTTFPPIVPDIWRDIAEGDQHDLAGAPFTTICNWSAYGPIIYKGEHYGQKDEEFLRLIELPGVISQQLELTVSGTSPEIIDQFSKAGWSIRQANAINIDFSAYKTYIGQSKGEFSVAKNGYVKSRSGWISDRSACYLAAGRPVVVQDTGIGDWLPTGSGILLFSTLDEAAACIDEIDNDYAMHRRAARDLAHEYFSAPRVLSRIIEIALG